jgi:hypothetical protein
VASSSPNDVGVTAERQVGVDAALERDEPLLLQPRALRPRPGLVGELAERRAAPQRERVAQRRGGALGVTRRERAATVVEQPLEPGRVERVVVEHELVRVPARAQRVRRGQRAPELRDEVLHHLRRGGRGVAVPELLDDAVARHRAVALDDQQREQLTLAAAAERRRMRVVEYLERTEDADVHVALGRA